MSALWGPSANVDLLASGDPLERELGECEREFQERCRDGFVDDAAMWNAWRAFEARLFSISDRARRRSLH